MRMYELAFIIQPNLDEEGVTNVVSKVEALISKVKGEIKTKNVWGRRRLAYPINNYREGVYVLFETNMPPASVTQVEQDLRLSEDVIRFLMFRADN